MIFQTFSEISDLCEIYFIANVLTFIWLTRTSRKRYNFSLKEADPYLRYTCRYKKRGLLFPQSEVNLAYSSYTIIFRVFCRHVRPLNYGLFAYHPNTCIGEYLGLYDYINIYKLQTKHATGTCLFLSM